MSEAEITLREYIEKMLELRDKAFKDYQAEITRAMGLASATIENRLEKLNELRQEVVKDRGLYITRVEYDAKHEDLKQQLSLMQGWQNKVIGIGLVLVLLMGLIGAFIGKVMFGGGYK